MFIPVFGMGSNFLLGEATYHVAYLCLLFVEVKYHCTTPLTVRIYKHISSLLSLRYSVGIWRGSSARGNPFQRRRVASQTKPLHACHPERSEGSLAAERSFARAQDDKARWSRL